MDISIDLIDKVRNAVPEIPADSARLDNLPQGKVIIDLGHVEHRAFQ